jgi:hypothetical protein
MTMIQHQCPRFHLYNAAEGQDSGPARVCAAATADADGSLHAHARCVGRCRPRRRSDASSLAPKRPARRFGGKTVGAYAFVGAAVEPVVGWLACVKGPDKGRDWRLVSGRNAIGRGDGMPVRLATDPAVSRLHHAVVSFDPRRASFTLAPGEGSALVYCNGQELLVPQTLAPFDRIELGASTLVFVPLVGDRFSWEPAGG